MSFFSLLNILILLLIWKPISPKEDLNDWYTILRRDSIHRGFILKPDYLKLLAHFPSKPPRLDPNGVFNGYFFPLFSFLARPRPCTFSPKFLTVHKMMSRLSVLVGLWSKTTTSKCFVGYKLPNLIFHVTCF